jgi:hypothetical protein
MSKRLIVFILLLTMAAFLVVFESYGSEGKGDFDTIEALVELLKEKGVLNRDEAAGFLERYKAQAGAGPGKVIRIIPEEQEQAYMKQVTEQVTAALQEDMAKVREDARKSAEESKAKANETEERLDRLETRVGGDIAMRLGQMDWAQRIRFGGDIRLRYEGNYFDKNNAILLRPDNPGEILNTTEDRTLHRYRVRVHVKASLLDDREVNVGKVEFGARVATGNDKNPVSTNDTLGDTFNKDGIVLDQAYLKWSYKPNRRIFGKLPQLSLTGGRMPNPFFHTDLVWDGDLNFEGLALDLRSDTLADNPWKAFLTAGAFPLQEEEFSDKDKWLYGGQIGLAYKRPLGLSGMLGIAYYDYKNIVGTANDPFRPGLTDFTAPQFQQKGNTLFDIDPGPGIRTALASEFQLINVTAKLIYDYWSPVHLVLTADYAKNLGFDQADVARRTGNPNVKEETEGYQFGLMVGYPSILGFGDWNVFLNYKYLEADSVLDAFTDSDFHLGGTNAKGWILGGRFGIYKNVWFEARWLTSDEISGPPLAIDVFQLDLNARF